MVKDVNRLSFVTRPHAESMLAAPTETSNCERDFVFGDENQLVGFVARYIETTSRQLTEARTLNPIYMYGDSGAGKSHMAQALAGIWNLSNHQASARVVSAEDLGRRPRVKSKSLRVPNTWRDSELLVIEDLQFLRRKQNAQLRLSRTIDDALAEGHQIILTGSCAPITCSYFVPRLASRLCGGLFFEIHKPGIAARKELIRQFAGNSGTALCEKALDLLAQSIDGTVLELRHTLQDVFDRFHAIEGPVGEAQVQMILNERRGRTGLQYSDRTIQAVARYFRIPMGQFIGKSRRQATVRARGIAIVMLRNSARMSFNQIGQLLGGRDHSTIMHALAKTEALLREDETLRSTLAELESIVESE